MEKLLRVVQPLARGRFAPAQLQLIHRAQPGRQTQPEIETEIDRLWREQTNRRPNLFNGAQVRLDSYTVRQTQLTLATSLTSYREFLGTNLSHPEWRNSYGLDFLANPIGISGLIKTTDGRLLLGRRAETVGEYPGFIDSIGGNLSPVEHLTEGQIDPFAAISREVTEELTIRAEQITALTNCGLWENGETWRPELIFEIKVGVAADAIELRGDEHVELLNIAATPEQVAGFLLAHEVELTPSCKAALLDLVE